MRYYDYPPSEYIRRYEPFEPNSHYYVRGHCIYEGEKYACDFEVVYTLKGNIYIVSYTDEYYRDLFSIPFADSPEALRKAFRRKKTRIQVSFSGIDLRNYWAIKIEHAVSIHHGGILENEPPVFIADSYTIQITDNWTLRSNLQTETQYEIINVFGINRDEADFNVSKSGKITLRVVTQEKNASLEGDNSKLIVSRKSIPIGWKADDVADLWCSCISLATGRDVRWIVKEAYTKKAITLTFVNRQNITRNLKTEGIFRTPYPSFWRDETVHQLISAAFSCAWNRTLSVEAARDYARIMWHFVEYRLITNRAEDQARLISTTVEELLTLWEAHTKKVAEGVITIEESEILWKEIQGSFLPNLKTLLPETNSEKRSDIKSQLKRLILKEMIDANFEEGLRNLFRSTKNSQEWFNNHVEARLKPFVDTRNKIAHTGKFPSQDTIELFEYYFDMLMILPLMIFSLFGYTGDYVDLAKEYRRINAKRLPKLETDEKR